MSVPPFFIPDLPQELQIILVARGRDKPGICGFLHLAARLVEMKTSAKTAVCGKGRKFTEAAAKALGIHLQKIQLTKTGRIRHNSSVLKANQLDMPGCMLSPAELHADLIRFQLQARNHGIEQRRLAYAGLSGEHADPSGELIHDLINADAFLGACDQDRVTDRFV